MPQDPPVQDRDATPPESPAAAEDASRRTLLERLAKAGYVAPAMLALLSTRPANADIVTCPPEGCG